MELLVTMFERYGLPLAFGAVLLEQVGPPIPSGPLLMVAGALVTQGRMSALSIAGAAWVASMLGKVALYLVGRRYGKQAMTPLCRLAVTPDSNANKTDLHFAQWGAALLILAEFIPGVRTLAPSVAGAERLSPVSFLLYSAFGAALWTSVYLGVGLAFSEQIDRGLVLLEQSGKIAVVVVIAVAIAYLAHRWWGRHRSVRAGQGALPTSRK